MNCLTVNFPFSGFRSVTYFLGGASHRHSASAANHCAVRRSDDGANKGTAGNRAGPAVTRPLENEEKFEAGEWSRFVKCCFDLGRLGRVSQQNINSKIKQSSQLTLWEWCSTWRILEMPLMPISCLKAAITLPFPISISPIQTSRVERTRDLDLWKRCELRNGN